MGNLTMEERRTRRDRSLLQAHRQLLRVGLSLVSVFSWIFVFEYFFASSGSVATAFLGALVVYAIAQATAAFLTPVAAAHLRHGTKRAMILGACVAALSFAVLGGTFAGYFSTSGSGGVVLFGLLLGIYRALYRIPYRLQSAPGRGPHALFEVLVALMPAFAGLALIGASMAPLRLLFGAAALLVISILPILPIADFGERFAWGYSETFRQVFERRNRVLSTRAVLAGVENAALFILWPLSIFLILGGSYLLIGLVMSTSLLILLALRDVYREAARRVLARESLVLDVAFATSGWVFRLASGTPIAFIFADSYSYVSARNGAPEFASHEHAADGLSYLDEYTALQEIGQSFGRIAMCIFAGILIWFLPLSIALAIALIAAACAAGASAALSHQIRARAY